VGTGGKKGWGGWKGEGEGGQLEGLGYLELGFSFYTLFFRFN